MRPPEGTQAAMTAVVATGVALAGRAAVVDELEVVVATVGRQCTSHILGSDTTSTAIWHASSRTTPCIRTLTCLANRLSSLHALVARRPDQYHAGHRALTSYGCRRSAPRAQM